MNLSKGWGCLVVVLALLLNTVTAVGAELKVSTENGITTIVYKGMNVFIRANKDELN